MRFDCPLGFVISVIDFEAEVSKDRKTRGNQSGAVPKPYAIIRLYQVMSPNSNRRIRINHRIPADSIRKFTFETGQQGTPKQAPLP